MLGKVEADADVLPHQQNHQDSHNNEVANHRTRQACEIDEQDGHEQRETEGNNVQFHNRLLATQYRDYLIQEVDDSRYATCGDHDEAQAPELLEIDAVHKAHDRNADPTHKEDNHQR